MNLKKYSFLKNFFDKNFWQQNPEHVLGYSPIISEIKKAKLKNSKILEIKSNFPGLATFLDKSANEIDINSFTHTGDLPLKKNFYDISVAMDVLAELDPNLREKAIYELIRVSKKLVLLTVSSSQDFVILSKQPKTDEVLVFIDRSLRKLKKNAQIKSYPNLNLNLKKILVYSQLNKSQKAAIISKTIFLILIPILKFCNFSKTYRRIFVIKLQL